MTVQVPQAVPGIPAAATGPRIGINPWVAFAIRRILSLILIAVILLIAVFLLVRLIPGDPAANVSGIGANPAAIAEVRKQLGLDLPIWQQFGNYVIGLLHGDLGSSFITKEPVTQVLAQRAPASLQLAAVALVVTLIISIPVGLISAAATRDGRHRRGEFVFTAVTSVFGAIPEFLMATLLSIVFAVWLRILPAAGTGSIATLILPAAAVAIRPIAILARMVRVETLGALSTDYVRTANGKRLRGGIVYLKHILPNVVTSALTIGGLLFPGLVGAAVVVENIFARAGLGTQLVTAVVQRDYPVIQGCILLLGIIVVSVNAVVDLIVAAIDPRAVTRKV